MRPSGAGLDLGTRVSFSRLTPSRVTPHRGCASADAWLSTWSFRFGAKAVRRLSRRGDLLGNGPHEADRFSSEGHHDLIGLFPACEESSIAFAQPDLRLPTDSLDRFGELFETELEMAADLGRIAGGPGAFNQCPAGLGIACLGNAALATMIPASIF